MKSWRAAATLHLTAIAIVGLTIGSRPALAAIEFDNGGFESIGQDGLPAGWTVGRHFGKKSPGATFTLDDAIRQDGVLSFKITRKDADVPAIVMSGSVDVEAGATYLLTAQLRSDTKTTSARMMVVPTDFKRIATATLSVGDAWQGSTVEFKAPASGVLPVSIRFDLMQPGTLWIDNITFVKTSPGTGVVSDAAAALPPAQILDGGFEQSAAGAMPAGWQIGKHYDKFATGATFVVDDTVGRTGKRSLRINSPTDESIPAIAMSNPVAVDPGEPYVITAWMRSDKPAHAQIMALRSDLKGADRAPIELTSEWRRYRLFFQSAKESTGYFARFDAQHGTIWIDDVSLTKASIAAAEEASQPGPALGYRYAETPGEKSITLAVGAPTGQTLPNLNGICYHRGFGAKSLSTKFAEIKPKVVRLHNVLSHQEILQKQSDGSFKYDYTLLDKSIDEILAIGAVPQISLCFVPVEMVDNPDPAKIRDKFYMGQPSDYAKWEAYIADVVRHCSEKYPNVADWYWIFGNEPGVRQFSMGTHEEFYTLYKHTLAAATRANDKIQIGAGSFAHYAWLKDFVRRCDADKTRVDLISFHHYDIVPGDYAIRVADVRAFIQKYPVTANAKLAIDEWNPILPDARPKEYSAGNYAAAHAAASVYAMMKAGLDYETHFIASSNAGNGMVGSKDLKHPVFNAFALMAMMGPKELTMRVPEGEPYIGGYATQADDGTITVLVWHVKSKNDVSPDVTKTITVALEAVKPTASVTQYVVDHQLSNGLSDPKRQDLETVPAQLRERGAGGAEIVYEAPVNSVSLLRIKP